MTPDPLAEVFLPALTGSHDWSDEQLAASMARAAREHIAAEIEAAVEPASGQPTFFHNEGMLDAARIARGQS